MTGPAPIESLELVIPFAVAPLAAAARGRSHATRPAARVALAVCLLAGFLAWWLLVARYDPGPLRPTIWAYPSRVLVGMALGTIHGAGAVAWGAAAARPSRIARRVGYGLVGIALAGTVFSAATALFGPRGCPGQP